MTQALIFFFTPSQVSAGLPGLSTTGPIQSLFLTEKKTEFQLILANSRKGIKTQNPVFLARLEGQIVPAELRRGQITQV